MAPALILFPLLVVAACLVSIGMQKGWQATFGTLLHQIAEGLRKLPSVTVLRHTIGFGVVGDVIDHWNASVYNWFGMLIMHTEKPVAMMFRYFADVFEKPAKEAMLYVADVNHTLTMLRYFIFPEMIAAKVAWIPIHLAGLDAKVARLLHRAPIHIKKDITNYAKGAFVATTTIAIAWPKARIRGIERDVDWLRKRVGKLAHRVPVALTAAALTAIVAKTAFRWVRCAKVGRAGKRICGMDEDLLGTLIAQTLLVTYTISLVEFAKEMQNVTDLVTEPVRDFWRA